MSRETRRSAVLRSFILWVILGLVVVTGVVGYFIIVGSAQSGTGSESGTNGMPVSPTMLSQLSGVSVSALRQVDSYQPSVASTKPTGSSTPLTLNGKPEILYMGAEYCPYCAAERWAMIVALDKFGSFTGLEYMQSSSTDIYPNTPTFTFKDATYTSDHITFVSVEQLDRDSKPLQAATANETALLKQYGGVLGSIPFVDIGNQYVLTGSQYSPAALRVGNGASGAPYNWTQIASQLDNSSSFFAQNIDAAANHLISAICKIDGGAPTSVCSQSFAQLVSYSSDSPPEGTSLLVSEVVSGGAAPSHGVARAPVSQNVGLERK
jgi:thiol-disulfide isomerase/thioredoxin